MAAKVKDDDLYELLGKNPHKSLRYGASLVITDEVRGLAVSGSQLLGRTRPTLSPSSCIGRPPPIKLCQQNHPHGRG